ncbi:MAG TPA: hypothetical protein VLF94_03285, partial [Chlamydiales bacterium]|nr:hypothetical protein [Chlamydiales bacterium]
LLHNSSLLDGSITTERTEITERRKKDLNVPSVLSVISVVNLIYATTPPRGKRATQREIGISSKSFN